jgi:hypothetical protein
MPAVPQTAPGDSPPAATLPSRRTSPGIRQTRLRSPPAELFLTMSRRAVSSPLVLPLTSTYAGARKRRQAPISIGGRRLPLKLPLRPGAFRARAPVTSSSAADPDAPVKVCVEVSEHRAQASAGRVVVLSPGGRPERRRPAGIRQLIGPWPPRQTHRLASWFPPGEH